MKPDTATKDRHWDTERQEWIYPSDTANAEEVFQDLAKRFVAEKADEYDYMRDLMLDAHEKLMEGRWPRKHK